MKPLTLLLTAVLLSTASLTACSEESMSIQERTEQRFKLNPNPQEAYRIRIKINDAPGSFNFISDMEVGYAARNCSYIINHFAGATASPEKDVTSPIRQIGQDEYESIFYADAVQDEDYFGEGVCRWQPESFGVAFKATGKEEETAFSISGIMEDLIEKKTITKYYWKGGYPYYKNDDGSIYISKTGEMDDSGTSPDLLDKMYTDEQRKNLFNITVTLEEVK